MITDACVPLSRLSDLISLTREALDASWLPAPIIAHAGLTPQSCAAHLFFQLLLSWASYFESILCFRSEHRTTTTLLLLLNSHACFCSSFNEFKLKQIKIKCIFQLTGDGNFHVLLMVRADVLEDVHEAHRLAGDIATAAISMGGTCTGEHGEWGEEDEERGVGRGGAGKEMRWMGEGSVGREGDEEWGVGRGGGWECNRVS